MVANKKKSKDSLIFFTAVALIVGTIIGAGVFGIPYAIAQSGFSIGLVHLVVLGFFVTLMTLYMGEVVLRTKEESQFIGLADKYLGNEGKWLMFISMVVGIFGALTAYLVGIGSSVAHLIGMYPPIVYTLIFFAFAAPIIYYGLKSISIIGLVLSTLLILILFVIILGLFPEVQMSNLEHIDFSKAMVPYGVILFACLGYSVIPEVEMLLKKQRDKMFFAIILATFICIGLYTLFSFTVVGVYGFNVAEIATQSLSGIKNVFGTIVAILAMATGFLALGLVMKHVFSLDLKIDKRISWIIVCFFPLLIVFFISPGFVEALGFTGTYAGGLTGILSCFLVYNARKKGKRKPEYVVPGGTFLIVLSGLVFIGGIVYQTVHLLGFI